MRAWLTGLVVVIALGGSARAESLFATWQAQAEGAGPYVLCERVYLPWFRGYLAAGRAFDRSDPPAPGAAADAPGAAEASPVGALAFLPSRDRGATAEALLVSLVADDVMARVFGVAYGDSAGDAVARIATAKTACPRLPTHALYTGGVTRADLMRTVARLSSTPVRQTPGMMAGALIRAHEAVSPTRPVDLELDLEAFGNLYELRHRLRVLRQASGGRLYMALIDRATARAFRASLSALVDRVAAEIERREAGAPPTPCCSRNPETGVPGWLDARAFVTDAPVMLDEAARRVTSKAGPLRLFARTED